jgi:hypothetical protein
MFFRFPHQKPCIHLSVPHTRYMPRPSLCFPNNTLLKVPTNATKNMEWRRSPANS